jgi:hypothetical protein
MATTATEPQGKKLVPPYIPYKTFVNLLAGWKVHLPQRIDRSVLGTYAGGTQSAIISALRYLTLITVDNEPVGTLEGLARAEGPERQKLLKQLLRVGYPFMFSQGFDVTKATPAQIDERFADTGATGDTLSKCLSFFTGMAKDAGIALTPHLKTRQRRATTTKRTKKNGTPDHGIPDPPKHRQDDAPPTDFERLPIPGIGGAFIQYPAALTNTDCDLLEAMIGVLRTYAKGRSVGKEKKP